jgi:toxin CcdB
MAQFDVHPFGRTAFLVDCQSESLSHLATRVVVPLMRSEDVPLPMVRLNPVMTVHGAAFVLATHLLTAVPRSELGAPVASLVDQEYAIKNALDMLLSGV